MKDFAKATILVTALALSTAMAPIAAAGTASHSDEITPSAFIPSMSTAHRFYLDLSVNETVDVQLDWDDQYTDLDVFLSPSSASCELPDEIECVRDKAADRARVAACMSPEQGRSVGVGPATETFSTKADDHDAGEAEYSLWVAASTAVPLRSVPYTLEVTTGDDGHEGVEDGRERWTVVRPGGHCRTP